ncbi:hypothetical protein BJ980_002590 [Nocardioides daedukensis]|uniref:WXG100 family type VII secretion target n=1 Tax=Nocardioides daedukensis TaxID=634462 RepID=A0A7Y9UQV1_9ACTN|nr:hypothetical protein [Nocardioides daedukensis]NYG59667.1 hypothetical protein [Nocardioides daedukensis]
MAGEGTEVITNDVTRAAAQIKAAAKDVASADPSEDLTIIGTALPGSKSATAATTLSTTWEKRFTNWKKDAKDQSAEMVASADTYDQADADVNRNMGRLKPELI